jgi:hypothetical protein
VFQLVSRTFAPESSRRDRGMLAAACRHNGLAKAGTCVSVDVVCGTPEIDQTNSYLVEVFVLEEVGRVEVVSIVHAQFASSLDEGTYLSRVTRP